MDWLAVVENLIFLFAGAIVGLFSSIGFDLWKQQRERSQLKHRIREELEITKKEIKSDLENKNIHNRHFYEEVFDALQQDLIRKLDVSTYRVIQESYKKIQSLVNFTYPEETVRGYKEALDSINKTLDLLDKQH